MICKKKLNSKIEILYNLLYSCIEQFDQVHSIKDLSVIFFWFYKSALIIIVYIKLSITSTDIFTNVF